MRARVTIAALLMLALAPAARGEQADEPLAVVGDRVITRAEFERELERRGGGLPGQYETAEQRRALLDVLVRSEVLAQRAREAGYDRDPQVLEALERIIVSRFRQDRLEPLLAEVDVTDDEVAAFYEQHRDDYARPARIQVAIAHVAVSSMADETRRAEREQRAQEAHAAALEIAETVRHLGAVARTYSDDRASRYAGGVIGWLSQEMRDRYKWDPAVLDAAFALEEEGAIAPLVSTDDGFYVVRLVRREEARARPLSELEDGLRYQLLKQRQDEVRERFVEALFEGVPVDVRESVFSTIGPPGPTTTPPTTPPATPGR